MPPPEPVDALTAGAPVAAPDGAVPVVHGLDQSYFTGKLEAWLRAKGIAHRVVRMDIADFRRCARATGIAQMPQLEMPGGEWLTDTTAILALLGKRFPEPVLSPVEPVPRFFSLLLEDFGDEWLWRPALYYRWRFADDARLLGSSIAAALMRRVPLPMAVRYRLIRSRQRRHFLRGDGVDAATAPLVERLYRDTLDGMEAALAHRPFLFGERPVEADFGFFGSMFRHFSSDPTPARIMRDRAPRVLAWVARLWALRPADLAAAPVPDRLPGELDALLALVTGEYLPYLAANEAAFARGERVFERIDRGVRWRESVHPYRVHCLAALRESRLALVAADRARVDARLGPAATVLAAPPSARLPEGPRPGGRWLDHRWGVRARLDH